MSSLGFVLKRGKERPEAVHISLEIVLLIMYNFLNQTYRVEAKDLPKSEIYGSFLPDGT